MIGNFAGHLARLTADRGAWCPYCNITLRTYRSELLPGLRERGTELAALSPQKPDGSMPMKKNHDLEFAVLSDPGLAVARAIGVVIGPTEDSLAAQAAIDDRNDL